MAYQPHHLPLIPQTSAQGTADVKLPLLPAELWSLIIRFDDPCHAWFIIRHLSRFFRLVTEDVFAKRIIQNTAVTLQISNQIFESATKELISSQNPESSVDTDHTWQSVMLACTCIRDSRHFKGDHFFPPSTRERVVLNTRNHSGGPTPCYLDGCGSDIFAPCRQKMREKLQKSSHFVRLGSELKSFKIPSLEFDCTKKQLSVDWRLLCQAFYHQELKSRRSQKPWLQDVTRDPSYRPEVLQSGVRAAFLLGWAVDSADIEDDGWIFWDTLRDTKARNCVQRFLTLGS